ncbi:TrkA family potassium uptake protein [Alkalibacterium putridalgicola]|jgi:voltage-gated potassium channel|uniref:Potassium transporter TrkA n=1 Tax=Alkalibacterium putridalgicola TaxID=426703 RepID=A0A1H7X681_9LACT|nr:potassium channel protein [Alkalibacterium putridalgicola]GEK90276.1 potassium transporter TrkA [Alkalibacterium putridalgicola]SEM28648.1 voltage-gated potassium channel [Alkalibacterium putridalgicola]
MQQHKRTLYILYLLVAIILIGIGGYYLLLDISLMDAFYMTVITISTVGFQEVVPLTVPAQLFTIILIFFSLGTLGYTGSQLISFFFGGTLQEVWREQKMKDRLADLNDHIIVCGAGETGQHIIQSLERENVEFVVIEFEEDKLEAIKEYDNVIAFQGDATQDEVLEKAGIHRAKGLIAALNSDANNLYTVLTARQLKPDLLIVARAITHNSHEKLIRAGADKTVSPNEIGGHRMASMLLKPSVIAFLDTITHSGKIDLNLNEVVIQPSSAISNKTLMQANIPEQTDLIIIAIKEKEDDGIVFNPTKDHLLKPGQTLIALGDNDDLKKLKKLAGA